ncbi:hypothetical protein EDC04DRAFT_2655432 [Pisolithus marmoratus]|nr:hypothetical protein EDC04DRAFT_2655432 [Pisolithus marmoratus]
MHQILALNCQVRSTPYSSLRWLSPFFIGAGYLIISIGSLSFSRAFLAYPFRCTALAYSRTFVGLVLSCVLNGALNGNIGALKSMIVEINDETNEA